LSSSAVQRFRDPDVCTQAIRASVVEMPVVGRGEFDATVTRIDLDRLWMQGFGESVPRTMRLTVPPERDVIYFATAEGQPLFRNGVVVDCTRIVRMAANQDSFQRSERPIQAGSMSLPPDHLRSMAVAITGRDVSPLKDDRIIKPPAAAMARLQRLHAAARGLAAEAPEVIANVAAARGLEQALTEAMIDCLSDATIVEESAAQRRHERVMQRFHAALEERPDEAVFVPDMCALIGASQRTLEMCCHGSLGVSPKRYLLLRRLTQARKTLSRADPRETTVTMVAADCGFWHFGRFAAEYKAVYGESPSCTLRGAASDAAAA